ncbi:hypothetical protein FEM48_Zijuj07G0117400 [Ziziphus jujuba var. spinosa]|uniref:F-box domain-containing protein n=1 Tax=Ziziphus jujuba var. spinosa TaxID=714518 RepID=A0A978V4F8_ZIZJJ|nr:hypothetical protein FEM48_Zijuj07G0117400 [Ziziphus jujuba var. spinosa]
MAKRLCADESNCPNLPIELLELIVKELHFDQDMSCFKAVCPSWKLEYGCKILSFLIPELLISTTDNQQEDHKSYTSSSRFFSLRENKVYTFKKVFGRFSAEAHCVGSSRGVLGDFGRIKKDPKSLSRTVEVWDSQDNININNSPTKMSTIEYWPKWVPMRSLSDRAKLIDEYQHCVKSERYSTYNCDDYLTQSLVCLDQSSW